MRTERGLLILLASALALAGCQSLQPEGATRAEKSAALAARLPEWKAPHLVNQFARPRTVQLFNNLVLAPDQRRLESTSTGLATVLTTDGYALTAAHVLDDGPLSVLRLKEPRAGHLTLTGAGPVFFSARRPDTPVRVRLDALEALPVRTVVRFRGSDLALVKLPLAAAHVFDMASGPPPAGTTVFAYGSNLSGNSSAGQVLEVRSRRPLAASFTVWRLTTDVPLRQGDSGGPLMDPDGALVGIVSRGQAGLLEPKIRRTIALGVSPETLRALIARDRTGDR